MGDILLTGVGYKKVECFEGQVRPLEKKDEKRRGCFISRIEWGRKKRTVSRLPLRKTLRRVPIFWLILQVAPQFCDKLNCIGLITSGVTLVDIHLLGKLVILELM